jgi:hypothetical protein
MSAEWQYHVRIELADGLAEAARRDPEAPPLGALMQILRRHDAALLCQLDAFTGYVAEAEEQGAERFPLYKWTKATLDDPVRRRKHMTTFAVRVAGHEVYARATAEALEGALRPFVESGLITRMSRHDTNPANNLPVPGEFR